jgi:hypothetical protein
VNNNWLENRTVEDAVSRFREWQVSDEGLKMQRGNSTAQRVNVTVFHTSVNQSDHNFARFIYVDSLRRNKPLDEVIFLDDDQYWPNTFISALLRAHRTKSMTTWYGKNFYKSVADGGLAQYWKQDDNFYDVVAGKIKTDTWKYGGTGGSIVDTNLWLLDDQLLRLSRDLKGWAKVDDLWASYILDALLGWTIHRLPVNIKPVDIGLFNQKTKYYTLLKQLKKVGIATENELRDVDIVSNARNVNGSIRDVATFTDPEVDKQLMFETLQMKFRWEAN